MPVCSKDNINIYYEVHGEGFPLVLSHSFISSTAFWVPQMAAFSAGYRVITYDIRGHGLSSAPAGAEHYSLKTLVEDLHNLIEHLGIEKAYIGGLSLGGAISLAYASLYPQTVEALLVCDIGGGYQPSNPEMAAQRAEALREFARIGREMGMADLARYQIATGTGFPPFLEGEDGQQQYVKAIFPPYLESGEWQQQYVKDLAGCPVNGFAGVSQAVPWLDPWQREASKKITAPTLLTVGGRDAVIEGVKELHRHIKNSRYVEISGSFHCTSSWRPDLFNQAVLEFLETVEQGKPVAGEIALG